MRCSATPRPVRALPARARLLGGAALLALLAACGSGGQVPDRDPDVTGVVGHEGDAVVLTAPSDDYFEGMTISGGDETVVVDAGGSTVTTADLATGDEVEVWVGDACRESFPVQCDVLAVRVVG